MVEVKTLTDSMLNTAVVAEQAATTMMLALVPRLVLLYTVEVAAAQDAVMAEQVQQEPVVHGEVIP